MLELRGYHMLLKHERDWLISIWKRSFRQYQPMRYQVSLLANGNLSEIRGPWWSWSRKNISISFTIGTLKFMRKSIGIRTCGLISNSWFYPSFKIQSYPSVRFIAEIRSNHYISGGSFRWILILEFGIYLRYPTAGKTIWQLPKYEFS